MIVSSAGIGVARKINIKGAAGLAKRTINCVVIKIINCYQTVAWQGRVFNYSQVYP